VIVAAVFGTWKTAGIMRSLQFKLRLDEVAMRKCHQCGEEFGIMRHILLRGRFCSKTCFEANEKDVSRMLDWISRHHADNGANLTNSASQTRTLNAPRPDVIQLQEGRTDGSLYFIGADLWVFRIAQLMDPVHAIFGVEVPWPTAWRRAAAGRDSLALPSMKRLVAPYVAAIRSHSRSSRCVLAGYSFCGLMAFEAAHQLREEGVKVDMVMLLDAAAKHPTPRQVAWQKLQEHWIEAPNQSRSIVSRLESSLFTMQWMITKETRKLGRQFLQVVLRDLDELTEKSDDLGMPLHWALVEGVYANALSSYRLRSLDSRGFLFRTDAKDQRFARAIDDSLGWKNLFSRGLEIIEIPGGHQTMMLREPYNLMLAQKMSELLRYPW
jgi:thioesterase domain-containing protein